MQRITTNVQPTTYARLEDLARRRGVSTAHLIREAMERYVTEQEAELAPQPLPDWVGMFSGPGDEFASRDEEVLERGWVKDLDWRSSDEKAP
jgi:hypothetical protein